MNKQHWLVFLFLILLLMACAPAELEPAADPVLITRATATGLPPTPTLFTVDDSVSEAAESTPTPVPTLTPTVTPLVTRTPTVLPGTIPPTPDGPLPPPPTPTPAAPLAGLIFRTNDGLWQTGPAGEVTLLFEQPDALLSPDGQQVIYVEEGDIWWVDLAGGERRNLTAGSNRDSCCARWWPSNPGWVVFGSQPKDADPGPSTGFLSMVHIDGSGYTILDEAGQSNAFPSPGPNGFIAYDRGGAAWLYGPDGSQPLETIFYGGDLPELLRIAGPAWSPDGGRLAWTVAVPLGPQGWQIAVAVFDLVHVEAWLLHPYDNVGRGGWFPPPAWSPDGRWLAFVVEAADREAAGLWAVAADGSTESFIAAGQDPVWDPDGGWLAFNGVVNGEPGIWLAQTGSWGMIRLDLPAGAAVVDWR